MATWLKQSTAIDVSVGPFVDATDGVTPETTLTITQPDIRLKKNGGAWAQKNAAQTLSHEENGWYEIALDTTDTNTLGNLLIAVNESGALPVWREFQVVTANVWDSFFGADTLQADVTQWLGQAVAAVTVNGVPEVDVTHWRGTAAAAPTVAGVPAVEVIDMSAAGQTDVRAAVGLAAADLDTQLAALPTAAEVAVAVLEESIGAHDAVPDSLAEYISNTDDRTVTILDDIADVPTAAENADAVWEEQIGDHSGTAGSTAETLANLPSAGTVAFNVWEELVSNHSSSAGSFGEAIDDMPASVVVHAVDGSTTLAESLRLSNSALGGKLSGAGTGTETVRDLADTKDRLVYTVDNDGNRTAITRDLA